MKKTVGLWEAIAGGEEWSIGLEFDYGDVWDAVFVGGEISEEDSQPIF